MGLFTRSMSQMYTLGAKITCNNIAGLANFQRQVCRENPDVIVSIAKGAKLGVEECKQQMKDQRWNCSTVARDAGLFGKVVRKGELKTYSSSSNYLYQVHAVYKLTYTHTYNPSNYNLGKLQKSNKNVIYKGFFACRYKPTIINKTAWLFHFMGTH